MTDGVTQDQTSPGATAPAVSEPPAMGAAPAAPSAMSPTPTAEQVPATAEAGQPTSQPSSDLGMDEVPVPEIEPWPSAGTAEQTFEVYAPVPKDGLPNEPILPAPSTSQERTNAYLERMPNLDYQAQPDSQEWGNVLESGAFVTQANDGFRSTVDEPGRHFVQAVTSEKGLLAAGVPKFKEDTGGVSWTGEKAVLRIKSLLGMGSIVQVPLWHSGFWLTLKAPSEGAMLELNRRIGEEKVNLGRQTHGLAFANTSVFIAGLMVDFALGNVYDCTVSPGALEKKDLRDRISCLDLPILLWGLACAIWPRGFPYARAILDKNGVETKVLREMLNVAKLLWTDTTSLTKWQVGHMAQRQPGSMSEEALQRYRDDFVRGKGRKIDLGYNISITTKVPSLREYLTSGFRWVNNIVQMVDKSFSMPPDSEERNQYITDQGKASNMRQYGHWIESVEASGDVTTHVDTLELLLDALSSKDDVREAYFKGVQQFMEDATMAVIAVPATEEEEERKVLPRFPNLIPLDTLSVFFTLLVQKASQIQSRS